MRSMSENDSQPAAGQTIVKGPSKLKSEITTPAHRLLDSSDCPWARSSPLHAFTGILDRCSEPGTTLRPDAVSFGELTPGIRLLP